MQFQVSLANRIVVKWTLFVMTHLYDCDKKSCCFAGEVHMQDIRRVTVKCLYIIRLFMQKAHLLGKYMGHSFLLTN